MPRLSWVIPCLSASVDKFNNTVSLFQVVEEMQVPADVIDPEPGTAHRSVGFLVISHWVREKPDKPEHVKARLTIIGPRTRKLLGHAEFDVDLMNFKRVRQLSNLPTFPYVGPGDYYIETQVQRNGKWRRLDRTWLEIKKLVAPEDAH